MVLLAKNKKTYYNLYLNIVMYFLLNLIIFFIVKNDVKKNEVLINSSVWTSVIYFICYVHNTFILKKLLINNKKIFLYLLTIPFFVLLSTVVIFYTTTFVNKNFVYIPKDDNDTFLGHLIMILFWLPVSSAFYLAMRSFIERAERKSLENEKLKIEIDFLKNQINPHFFFNTLNNLYGLTLEKSPKAPEMIIQLSDLMRYNIYESLVERIFLEKELQIIKDYIELKKCCFENFKYTLKTEISDENSKIAPKILINFVENSFKHGVERNVQNPFIDIYLSSSANEIKFILKNNFPLEDSGKISSGIGLENVKKQLGLIYPRKHMLKINVENDIFLVELLITNNER